MFLELARLAQMVERTAFNRMVVGSSPTVGTHSAGVPERSKGVDLRSTASASWVRIPPPAQLFSILTAILNRILSRWSWVRVPHETYVSLAQLVERCTKSILIFCSLSLAVKRMA